MSDAPKAVGRPTKYKPEYCQMLIEHMSQGGTFTGFAGHPLVLVDIDTLYAWLKSYPEFSEAKKKAQSSSHFFYDALGVQGMTGQIQNFNATMYIFHRKNMHGWKDKSQVDINEITDVSFGDDEEQAG